MKKIRRTAQSIASFFFRANFAPPFGRLRGEENAKKPK